MGHVRNVSVLFTDLVGSTALSSSVSPDVADNLRRDHFAVLRQAVAEADGTEVKNLGDGLMVVFPTASAALACAVGMQQATEADNRGRAVPLGLRVGISAGEAVEEDGDYFGDPVVEAARLCARCEAGQVLAADVVRATAGRRNPHTCVPLGDLELKGLPEPVPTVEVSWEPLGKVLVQERVLLPARLAGRPAAGLVGRTDELESLTATFTRVSTGGGREVVVVSGEAGLGKTTLVAEAARTAFEAGACVLFGHAEEDLATPYGMFAEALGHLVTHASEDDLRSYVADCGAEVARIVPALTRRLPDLEPPSSSNAETERYMLFAAVVGLFRQVAADRPVLLVVDDLQWADSASLQLLRHLVGEDPAMRLLVLGTYRDTEVGTGHPLVDTLAALWRMDRVARVDLHGFDDREVVDLLTVTAGHELDDAGVGLAHALYRETDGNPFFVSEVLRNLVETGTLYRDDAGRWLSKLSLDELRLPYSVREVVGARVGRLGPEGTRVLSTAAVIGRDFDLELLARATEVDEDDVLELLEAAEAAALVRAPAMVAGRFTFAHALIQRTLYQDLSADRRARAHERVAGALEDITAGRPGDRVGELAHHWAQATRPADVAKAIGYAAAAGAAALDQLAPAEAVRWYTQSIDLLGADGDLHRRAELLVGLGDAQLQTGDATHRITLLEAARLADSTDDVNLLAAAALTNNRGWTSTIGETDAERLVVINRALERLRESDPATRARLLALAAVEQIFTAPLEQRLALAEEAVRLARSTDDPQARVMGQGMSTLAVVAPWTLDRRLDWAADAAQAADEIGDLSSRYYTRANLRMFLLESADRDGIDEQSTLIDGILERLPNATMRWNDSFQRALLALLDGDVDLGEQLIEAALALGVETGQPDAFIYYSGQIMNLFDSRGRFGDLAGLIEDAARDNVGLPVFRALLVQALAEAGDLDRCRDLFQRDRDDGFPMTEDSTWSGAYMSWSKVAVALGDRMAAVVLHERLLPYRDQVITSGITVSPLIGHYIARLEHLLGRLDDADASFARAHRIHQRLRAPQFVARTEVRWAEMLLDRRQGDDHANARALAAAAAGASTGQSGWDWIEREANAVIDRIA